MQMITPKELRRNLGRQVMVETGCVPYSYCTGELYEKPDGSLWVNLGLCFVEDLRIMDGDTITIEPSERTKKYQVSA